MSTPTPHIQAKKGDIAKIVIMPGDPLRAKLIAEKFLDNVKLVNEVRNMFAYTGTYRQKELTVMGSGMGMPSMGIYSYELYNFYDVDVIVRIGTAGGLNENLNLNDLVLGQATCTDSNYLSQFRMPGSISPIADFELLRKAYDVATLHKKNVKVGNLITSDSFYNADEEAHKKWQRMGVLAVEMESAALYANAMWSGKKALSMCSISDLPLKNKSMSSLDRQNSLIDMIKISLDLAIRI